MFIFEMPLWFFVVFLLLLLLLLLLCYYYMQVVFNLIKRIGGQLIFYAPGYVTTVSMSVFYFLLF